MTEEQRDGIEAIALDALDMWEPYIQSTRAQVPRADTKMGFDRYHSTYEVAGHLRLHIELLG